MRVGPHAKLEPSEMMKNLDLAPPGQDTWKAIVAQYQQPATVRALWQLLNTLVPYAALWWLMHLSLDWSYWLTAGLAVLAAGFMIRSFIIFHDCGHGSFLPSRRANAIVGFVTGIFTLTPFHQWRWEHAMHHATSGDLDRRGIGDIWTMTVQEYLKASRARRFAYRLARNPIVLFLLAPLYLFLVKQRFPTRNAAKRERYSVYATNVVVGVMAAGLIWAFGWKAYVLIQLGIILIAGSAGVWLFYVQHQFEGVYWERHEEWDYCQAALQGSSFYKLPKVLQWFSGTIGFHHIHHLSPRIPNYNLERCHKSEPLFQTVKPITLRESLKSFRFRLWDEQQRKLVGYGVLKRFSGVPTGSL